MDAEPLSLTMAITANESNAHFHTSNYVHDFNQGLKLDFPQGPLSVGILSTTDTWIFYVVGACFTVKSLRDTT